MTNSRLYAEYGDFHHDPRNKLCHYIGIPLIVGSLIGLLLRLDFFVVGTLGVSAGHFLLLLAGLYYAAQAPALALPMLAAASFLGALGRALPVPVAIGVFVVGWIFQFVGHLKYEGKSPAFLTNLLHLLVGPLWVLESAMGTEKT